jgi:hypothetical protein
MASRYSKWPFIQPIRKINPALTDIPHILKLGENIDELANKYYQDATLGWVIMCGNPEYDMEFKVPIGAKLRIPFPLSRVWEQFGISQEI